MSGGMETSYNDINLKDEKNKQAEEYLLQAWDVAGYHGLENEEIYPRTAKETRQMDELLTKWEDMGYRFESLDYLFGTP